MVQSLTLLVLRSEAHPGEHCLALQALEVWTSWLSKGTGLSDKALGASWAISGIHSRTGESTWDGGGDSTRGQGESWTAAFWGWRGAAQTEALLCA